MKTFWLLIYDRIRKGKLWPASRWIAPSSALWCTQEIGNGHSAVEQPGSCCSAGQCQHCHALNPLQMSSPLAPSSGWASTADGFISIFLLPTSLKSSEILCLAWSEVRGAPPAHTPSVLAQALSPGGSCARGSWPTRRQLEFLLHSYHMALPGGCFSWLSCHQF